MRDFSQAKRIVIKVGTNLLSTADGVDTRRLGIIAREIATLVKGGRQVILVTSGAIGMGRAALGIRHQVRELTMRQALAAVGQGILMHEYQKAFRRYDQQVAQVLLTNRIMSYRKYYVNLKNAVEKLLHLQVVPIVNENDCVSIDEIGLAFGDNDVLSALVASKIDAELLIILTDVAGLYERNPRLDKHARLIAVVPEITDKIRAMAGKAGSVHGTGGMVSKLNAIEIAARGGCRAVLADGTLDNVIGRIVAGETIGTLFLPKRRLSNRKRWLLNSLTDSRIEIDPGAAAALRRHRSLLAVGVTGFTGTFKVGDAVQLGDVAKGVTAVSSAQLRELLNEPRRGTHPRRGKPQVIVHANNLVLLNP